MQKFFTTIALMIASLGAVAVTTDKADARPPQVLYATYYYGSPYYSYSYVAPAPGYYGTIPSGSYYYQSPYYGSYHLEAGTWFEPDSVTPGYYKPSPAPATAPAPVAPAPVTPAPVAPAPSYYNPSYYYGSYSYPAPRSYWGTAPTGFYYGSYYVPYF
jgi:hypothetical protein